MPDGGELHTQSEYRAAFDGLRRFFAGRGVPSEEAADLAQEALTRTFVHIKRHGRNNEDLWPLLTTVARNLYSDRGRRSSPSTVPLSEALELADSDLTPDDLVIRRERRDSVRAAVASLPARHRRAIELELRGMTPADIARELGIKRNAADALLHRARRSLASKLESMRGTFAALPLVVRLRSIVRRLSVSVSRIDPATGVAAAATSIAAVALVGAFGGGSAGGAQDRTPSRTAVLAASASASSVQTAPGRTTNAAASGRVAQSAIGNNEGLVTSSTSIRQEKVGAHVHAQDPMNPNDNNWGVEIWQQPDGHKSVIGDAVDRVSAGVCTKACSGGS